MPIKKRLFHKLLSFWNNVYISGVKRRTLRLSLSRNAPLSINSQSFIFISAFNNFYLRFLSNHLVFFFPLSQRCPHQCIEIIYSLTKLFPFISFTLLFSLSQYSPYYDLSRLLSISYLSLFFPFHSNSLSSPT